MAALGADVLDYIPDFVFKVRMNLAEARQVEISPWSRRSSSSPHTNLTRRCSRTISAFTLCA